MSGAVPGVFGLYLVVTNPVSGYVRCAEAAVRAGLAFVQLRMKHSDRAEVLRTAREMRAVTSGSGTFFIVNDDPSVAAESCADGVHLGQTDMSIAEARKQFPGIRIFGLSTHNPGQEEEACGLSPDYIGVGPVFPTPTKEKPDPVLGVDAAGSMIVHARAHGIASVAIGGVNESNISGVVRAGAVNFAVVRPVCGASDPYEAIRALTAEWVCALEKAGRTADLSAAVKRFRDVL